MDFNPLFIVLIVLFAFTDRFTGGGFGWDKLTVDHGGPLHGRGIYYAGPVLLALSWLLGGLPAVVLAVIWCVYRAAFGFSTGTTTGANLASTLMRHILPAPVVLFWAVHFEAPFWVVGAFVAYAIAATVLARWNGKQAAAGQDGNDVVETARGALYGVATVFALMQLPATA